MENSLDRARSKFNNSRDTVIIYRDSLRRSIEEAIAFIAKARQTEEGKEYFNGLSRPTFKCLDVEDFKDINFDEYKKDCESYQKIMDTITRFETDIVNMSIKLASTYKEKLVMHKMKLLSSEESINSFYDLAINSEKGSKFFNDNNITKDNITGMFKSLENIDEKLDPTEYEEDYKKYTNILHNIKDYKTSIKSYIDSELARFLD